jgi:hypothetical protein
VVVHAAAGLVSGHCNGHARTVGYDHTGLSVGSCPIHVDGGLQVVLSLLAVVGQGVLRRPAEDERIALDACRDTLGLDGVEIAGQRDVLCQEYDDRDADEGGNQPPSH